MQGIRQISRPTRKYIANHLITTASKNAELYLEAWTVIIGGMWRAIWLPGSSCVSAAEQRPKIVYFFVGCVRSDFPIGSALSHWPKCAHLARRHGSASRLATAFECARVWELSHTQLCVGGGGGLARLREVRCVQGNLLSLSAAFGTPHPSCDPSRHWGPIR
jgi:hypothetical protein